MREFEATLHPVDRRKPESIWLDAYRSNIVSQGGEDGVIAKIFEVIGAENRFVVDFGAGDGQNISNSFNLIHNQGWSGVLIEPGRQFAQLEERYRDRTDVATIKDIVGFDETNRLDAHLARVPFEVPREFDFLSIDIDGNDVHVWRDITAYRPRVVCIEFNHSIPNDVHILQPRDLSVNFGSSLRATIAVAAEMGYEIVATTSANAFFVTRELFPRFGIADNSIDAMHFNGRFETRLVWGYDGSIKIAGFRRHPWKGFLLDEERIQPLPSNMRQWKFDGALWPRGKLS